MAREYKDHLAPAWRAVVFALLSFIVSVVGSLEISQPTVANTVATAALGLLIVSAVWFYPTVRFAFKLEAIDTMLKISDAIKKSPPTPTVNESGAQAPNHDLKTET